VERRKEMNFFCQTRRFRSNSLKKKSTHLIHIMLLLALLLSAISCAGTSKTNIATVQSISGGYCAINGMTATCINVRLMPSSSALANKVYKVDLYEKGKLRDTTTVSWNQPEINVRQEKPASFPMSQQESDAYYMKDISGIFTVKVHE
jgi:hypothetical protein